MRFGRGGGTVGLNYCQNICENRVQKETDTFINLAILYGTFGNFYCHYCSGQSTEYMVFLNSRTESDELLPYK